MNIYNEVQRADDFTLEIMDYSSSNMEIVPYAGASVNNDSGYYELRIKRNLRQVVSLQSSFMISSHT